jgi:hypothetical protein
MANENIDLSPAEEIEEYINDYRAASPEEQASMKLFAIDQIKEFLSGAIEFSPNTADARNAWANVILEFTTDEHGELTEDGKKAYDKLLEIEADSPEVKARAQKIKNAAIAQLVASLSADISARPDAAKAPQNDARKVEPEAEPKPEIISAKSDSTGKKLYSGSIFDGELYRPRETPNEDTVFELTKTSNGSYTFTWTNVLAGTHSL